MVGFAPSAVRRLETAGCASRAIGVCKLCACVTVQCVCLHVRVCVCVKIIIIMIMVCVDNLVDNAKTREATKSSRGASGRAK